MRNNTAAEYGLRGFFIRAEGFNSCGHCDASAISCIRT
jgi:hypothetical protein